MSESEREKEARLMSEHMGLVASLARRFKPKNREDLEDLIQVGSIGLLKAIRKYDAEKAKLSTWAHQPIMWELMRYVNKHKNMRAEIPINSSLLSKMLEHSEVEDVTPYLPTSLTEKEEQVIHLMCHHYNVREISQHMKTSTYIVGKLFKSAVDKILVANEKT